MILLQFNSIALNLNQRIYSRHRENFWAFTGPRRDFGLILLILNMFIHKSFAGPTYFYSSALQAGGVLSSRSGWAGGRLPDLWNPYLCNRLTDLLHSKLCGMSRPVVVHYHGHLPICPICVCPRAKNLSNLPQIGSRLCGTHVYAVCEISEIFGSSNGPRMEESLVVRSILSGPLR